jgi:hypothetical protein
VQFGGERRLLSLVFVHTVFCATLISFGLRSFMEWLTYFAFGFLIGTAHSFIRFISLVVTCRSDFTAAYMEWSISSFFPPRNPTPYRLGRARNYYT